jgi:hypothetical protein
MSSSRNVCPVCGYDELFEPARTAGSGGSFEICASCGFQFGVSGKLGVMLTGESQYWSLDNL